MAAHSLGLNTPEAGRTSQDLKVQRIGVLVQRPNPVVTQGLRVRGVVLVHGEGVAVITVQPVFRSDPDEAPAVLEDAEYGRLGKALLDGDPVEADGLLLRVTGAVLRFPGFMRIYVEGSDNDKAAVKEGPKLPDLKQGAELQLVSLEPKQHFTQPPPRFTEASRIRELEEKGIGRPSTYASIVGVIQKKDYTIKEKGRLSRLSLECW